MASIVFIDDTIGTGNVDLERVKNQIDTNAKEVITIINSAGGSVAQGMQIHNYLQGLRQSGVRVMSYVLNAYSIATVIAQAADVRVMHPKGRFMIHYPRYPKQSIGGTATEIEHFLNKLKIKGAILENFYRRVSKATKTMIKTLMDKEYFMDAFTTYELGLIDKVSALAEITPVTSSYGNLNMVAMYEGDIPEPIFSNQNSNNMLEQFKEILSQAITALQSDPTVNLRLTTVDGKHIETDSEKAKIEKGTVAKEVKPDGKIETLADGSYQLIGGKTITIENGKIVEAKADEMKAPEKPEQVVDTAKEKAKAEAKEQAKEVAKTEAKQPEKAEAKAEAEEKPEAKETIEDQIKALAEQLKNVTDSVIPLLAKGEEVTGLKNELEELKSLAGTHKVEKAEQPANNFKPISFKDLQK